MKNINGLASRKSIASQFLMSAVLIFVVGCQKGETTKDSAENGAKSSVTTAQPQAGTQADAATKALGEELLKAFDFSKLFNFLAQDLVEKVPPVQKELLTDTVLQAINKESLQSRLAQTFERTLSAEEMTQFVALLKDEKNAALLIKYTAVAADVSGLVRGEIMRQVAANMPKQVPQQAPAPSATPAALLNSK